MNFTIIKAEIFKYKATQKTIWLFTRLEDNNNIVGWGEATLQGRENEILQNKKGVFELIVKTSPVAIFCAEIPIAGCSKNGFVYVTVLLPLDVVKLLSAMVLSSIFNLITICFTLLDV